MTPTVFTGSSTQKACQTRSYQPAARISSSTIESAAWTMATRSAFTSPMMRMARPGPGNGWRPVIDGGNAEGGAELAHLVLEELAQRLDELEPHALGQAADVVVALDGLRRALERHRLDDVRIERALGEELRRRAAACASSSNTSMKVTPMIRRFFSGSVMPARRSRNSVAGIDRLDAEMEGVAEELHDPLRLVAAQDAVVDEDAGELIADGAVDQRRGDGGVDAAREPADDAGRPHLGADARALAPR